MKKNWTLPICFVDASYNQNTISGVQYNKRVSIIGLKRKDKGQKTFPYLVKKSVENRRKCSSVKSAELFALDFGASLMCYLTEVYRHLSTNPVGLTLMTDSQTTIDF